MAVENVQQVKLAKTKLRQDTHKGLSRHFVSPPILVIWEGNGPFQQPRLIATAIHHHAARSKLWWQPYSQTVFFSSASPFHPEWVDEPDYINWQLRPKSLVMG
jgi:hypothetical protein